MSIRRHVSTYQEVIIRSISESQIIRHFYDKRYCCADVPSIIL